MKISFLLALSALNFQLSTLSHAQGSLTPPGAPGPVMKTLDQVEARKPVQSLAAAAPYTISQPGSYYLTGNITVAAGDAILIACDDVSLDLNGFTIRSTQTGTASGAAVGLSGDRSRLIVRNGSIVSGTTVPPGGAPVLAGFAVGIGDFVVHISEARVSDVHLTGLSGYGIYLDDMGVVERCTVIRCGGRGITADQVRDCAAYYCGTVGIYAFYSVAGCYGFSAAGVGIQTNGTATNCTGKSTESTGLFAFTAATGCTGISSSGPGLLCNGNATNSYGSSASGPQGLKALGTASYCRGNRNANGIAIQAANAIGCTAEAGTISAPLKSLGTP